jgi:hypothetical protein
MKLRRKVPIPKSSKLLYVAIENRDQITMFFKNSFSSLKSKVINAKLLIQFMFNVNKKSVEFKLE